MRFFRSFNFSRPNSGYPSGGSFSPFTSLSRSGIKLFVSIALALIGLGVLVLLFPVILAVFVAALCFVIAFFSLSYAWRIYRAGRPSRNSRRINVEITEPDNDLI